MWKITKHREPITTQELRVKSLINEMSEYSYATNAGEFETAFKQRITEIPRTNNFSADLMYKITQRNLKSVELWKLNIQGDFKYKLLTLDYQP